MYLENNQIINRTKKYKAIYKSWGINAYADAELVTILENTVGNIPQIYDSPLGSQYRGKLVFDSIDNAKNHYTIKTKLIERFNDYSSYQLIDVEIVETNEEYLPDTVNDNIFVWDKEEFKVVEDLDIHNTENIIVKYQDNSLVYNRADETLYLISDEQANPLYQLSQEVIQSDDAIENIQNQDIRNFRFNDSSLVNLRNSRLFNVDLNTEQLLIYNTQMFQGSINAEVVSGASEIDNSKFNRTQLNLGEISLIQSSHLNDVVVGETVLSGSVTNSAILLREKQSSLSIIDTAISSSQIKNASYDDNNFSNNTVNNTTFMNCDFIDVTFDVTSSNNNSFYDCYLDSTVYVPHGSLEYNYNHYRTQIENVTLDSVTGSFTFSNCQLNNVFITDSLLKSNRIDYCNINGLTISGTRFLNYTFQKVNMNDIAITRSTASSLMLNQCGLKNWDLSSAFGSSEVYGLDTINSTFDEVTASNMTIKSSSLYRVKNSDFSNSTLDGVTFHYTNTSDLYSNNITDTTIKALKFYNCELNDFNVKNIFSESTSSIALVNNCRMRNADFSDVYNAVTSSYSYNNLNIMYTDLSYSNLHNIVSEGDIRIDYSSTASYCDMTNAKIVATFAINQSTAKYANFSNTETKHFYVNASNVSYSNFSNISTDTGSFRILGSNCENCDFSNVTISATSNNVAVTNSNFKNATFLNSNIDDFMTKEQFRASVSNYENAIWVDGTLVSED